MDRMKMIETIRADQAAREQETQRANELTAWKATASQAQANVDYYRSIVVAIGELLGPAAHTTDDGVVVPEVLCAKVLELTKARLEALQAIAEVVAPGAYQLSNNPWNCVDQLGEIKRMCMLLGYYNVHIFPTH
jgi:hypothetical protein